MPTYCYRSRDKQHKLIQRVFSVSERTESFKENGRIYDRSPSDEWQGVGIPSSVWNNPLHCVASGVHPSQRKELEEYLAKKGVPTKVDADGNPIYTSAAHRKKALKARGMYDKSAYF